MFCTGCGNSLGEADHYCAQCGKPNAPGPGPSEKPPSQPQAPAWQRPPFARAMATKKLAGVCSGLARYLDLDVTLMRVIFLAGLILHLSTLFLYLFLWAVMSRDDRPPFNAPSAPKAA